jgi:S-adenosylmethionine hydrolase
MIPIITLTTDFGTSDAYVAAMKGVMLGIHPEARLVDISHSIKPQNVLQASFVLSTAYQFFPPRTIHLVVVDPGVGTERRAVILRTPLADFVAPDNGVLSYIVREYPAREESPNSSETKLGPGLEAVAITRPEFWRPEVSPTFHGRDVFAPVAAHLSLGRAPADFGEKVTSLAVLPVSLPLRAPDGALSGIILHIDSFGNLITNIRGEMLPEKRRNVTVEIGDRPINGLSRTYAEGYGLLALVGSSGYVEVSLKEGNASALLGVKEGDRVKITPRTPVGE